MAIRLGKNFEVGTGDDAQSAIAADEQLHQIVASNVLDDASTAFGDDAVAGHKADADAEISQSTVTVPQGTVRRRGRSPRARMPCPPAHTGTHRAAAPAGRRRSAGTSSRAPSRSTATRAISRARRSA